MEGYEREFWQFSDQLRLHNFSSLSIADSIWTPAVDRSNSNNNNKLAFATTTTNAADRYNYSSPSQQHLLNNKSVVGRPAAKINNYYYYSTSSDDIISGKKKGIDGRNNSKKSSSISSEKRLKRLAASESLAKEEAMGGYIFVCNKETMEENLKRQLFGLPSRYRESVRAIRPGLPLFLYNYSTHQLHGIFEAASFGGSNIDPTAWEDDDTKQSRFPAQICEPLEEDAFRPVLHHYDGPKFRLELSVAEAVSLLDIFAEKLFA
ncbi:B2 protein-like isoform X2 [Oryza brachyantha]|uniref:B2 protein-like isoform X2 n=1 Tax=Oryza brachyantha TaxID=4533 RepID=UPI001ADD51EB|nr:B2 protein-like isoform X2 [Oryza brachyantha]